MLNVQTLAINLKMQYKFQKYVTIALQKLQFNNCTKTIIWHQLHFNSCSATTALQQSHCNFTAKLALCNLLHISSTSVAQTKANDVGAHPCPRYVIAILILEKLFKTSGEVLHRATLC